jgi:hypothetical protein
MDNIHPNQRLPYSAIIDREPLKLPDNARVVIWPILALEVWDIIRPMARMIITPPQGSPLLPDFPNWSWHEYGMRVGFWRIKKNVRRIGNQTNCYIKRKNLLRIPPSC